MDSKIWYPQFQWTTLDGRNPAPVSIDNSETQRKEWDYLGINYLPTQDFFHPEIIFGAFPGFVASPIEMATGVGGTLATTHGHLEVQNMIHVQAVQILPFPCHGIKFYWVGL